MSDRFRSVRFLVSGEGVRDNHWYELPPDTPSVSYSTQSYTTLRAAPAPVSGVQTFARIFPAGTVETFSDENGSASTTSPIAAVNAVPTQHPQQHKQQQALQQQTPASANPRIQRSQNVHQPSPAPAVPQPANPPSHHPRQVHVAAAQPVGGRGTIGTASVAAPVTATVTATHAQPANPFESGHSAPSCVGRPPLHPAGVHHTISVQADPSLATGLPTARPAVVTSTVPSSSVVQGSTASATKAEPLPTQNASAAAAAVRASPAGPTSNMPVTTHVVNAVTPGTDSAGPNPRPRQLRTAHRLFAAPTTAAQTPTPAVGPPRSSSGPRHIAPSPVAPPQKVVPSPAAQSSHSVPVTSSQPATAASTAAAVTGTVGAASTTTDSLITTQASNDVSKERTPSAVNPSQTVSQTQQDSGTGQDANTTVLPTPPMQQEIRPEQPKSPTSAPATAKDSSPKATDSVQNPHFQRVRRRMHERRTSTPVATDPVLSTQRAAMQDIVARHSTSGDRRRIKSLAPLQKPLTKRSVSPSTSDHQIEPIAETTAAPTPSVVAAPSPATAPKPLPPTVPTPSPATASAPTPPPGTAPAPSPATATATAPTTAPAPSPAPAPVPAPSPKATPAPAPAPSPASATAPKPSPVTVPASASKSASAPVATPAPYPPASKPASTPTSLPSPVQTVAPSRGIVATPSISTPVTPSTSNVGDTAKQCPAVSHPTSTSVSASATKSSKPSTIPPPSAQKPTSSPPCAAAPAPTASVTQPIPKPTLLVKSSDTALQTGKAKHKSVPHTTKMPSANLENGVGKDSSPNSEPVMSQSVKPKQPGTDQAGTPSLIVTEKRAQGPLLEEGQSSEPSIMKQASAVVEPKPKQQSQQKQKVQQRQQPNSKSIEKCNQEGTSDSTPKGPSVQEDENRPSVDVLRKKRDSCSVEQPAEEPSGNVTSGIQFQSRGSSNGPPSSVSGPNAVPVAVTTAHIKAEPESVAPLQDAVEPVRSEQVGGQQVNYSTVDASSAPVLNRSSNPNTSLKKKRKVSEEDQPAMDVLRHLVKTVVNYNQKHSVRGRQFVEDRKNFLRDIIVKMNELGSQDSNGGLRPNRHLSVLPAPDVASPVPPHPVPSAVADKQGEKPGRADLTQRDHHKETQPLRQSRVDGEENQPSAKAESVLRDEPTESTRKNDETTSEDLRVLRKISLKFKEWKKEIDSGRKPIGDITDTMSRLNHILSKDNQVQLWDEIEDKEILEWLEQLEDGHRTVVSLWSEVSNNLLALRGITPDKGKIRVDTSKRLETLAHVVTWCHTLASWTINRCEMHQDGNPEILRKFLSSVTKFLEADQGARSRPEVNLLGRIRTISKNLSQFSAGRNSENWQLIAAADSLKERISLLKETASGLSDAARDLEERLEGPRQGDSRSAEPSRGRGRNNSARGASSALPSTSSGPALRRKTRAEESDTGRRYNRRNDDAPPVQERREVATSSRRFDSSNSQDGIELPSKLAPTKRKLSDGLYGKDDDRGPSAKKRAIETQASSTNNLNIDNRGTPNTIEREKTATSSTPCTTSKEAVRSNREYSGSTSRNSERLPTGTTEATEQPKKAVESAKDNRASSDQGPAHKNASTRPPRPSETSNGDKPIPSTNASTATANRKRTSPSGGSAADTLNYFMNQSASGKPKSAPQERKGLHSGNTTESGRAAADTGDISDKRNVVRNTNEANKNMNERVGKEQGPSVVSTDRIAGNANKNVAPKTSFNQRVEMPVSNQGGPARASPSADVSCATVARTTQNGTCRSALKSILRKEPSAAGASSSRSSRKITFHPQVVTKTSTRPNSTYDSLATLHLDGYDLLSDKIEVQAEAVNERVSQLTRHTLAVLFAYCVRYTESLKREAERIPPIDSDRMRLPYPPSALRQWGRDFGFPIPTGPQASNGRVMGGGLMLRSVRPPMPASQPVPVQNTITQNGVSHRGVHPHPVQHLQQQQQQQQMLLPQQQQAQHQHQHQLHHHQHQPQHPHQYPHQHQLQHHQHQHQHPHQHPHQHHHPHAHHQHQHQHQQHQQQQQLYNANQFQQHGGQGYSSNDATHNSHNHQTQNGGRSYQSHGPQ